MPTVSKHLICNLAVACPASLVQWVPTLATLPQRASRSLKAARPEWTAWASGRGRSVARSCPQSHARLARRESFAVLGRVVIVPVPMFFSLTIIVLCSGAR
jgi:hypothetical protein